ncbi:Spore germination GerAB [Acididesulfobacillus acetoxydans]|uniref:Spore germination GerAB n=1 Tax=Acididesulfobacillus acetoxydans TaxID=1561005 RepID=A0A8S0XYN4_9FIRM|nr:endospore germination permease [Acididesulfobacillus acetoxydans]CAA7602247.1 Spore germination GerAB [Acididesulfobacillus acetoxydans]CEJ07535.1 Spore germination protein [Acididesulfobacillus acetoxydans]
MPEKGIINSKQFAWLLFIIVTSVSTSQIPAMLVAAAGRDAWLSILGGWFINILVAILYAYMGLRFPGENFVQYSMTLLGKYLGRIVGIIFPLFFLLACATFLRGLSRLVNIAFLPDTPYEVILVSNFLVSAYIARKGIEVSARMTEVLGPLFFISGIVLFLMVIPLIDISRLKPQFANGVIPSLKGTPLAQAFFGLCIIMAMFMPVCDRPEKAFRAKFAAISMGTLFVGMLTAFSTGVFGVEQTKNMYSPGLMLARMVHFGTYLERIEILWMVILVGAGIVAAAILLWAFSLGIAQLAGLKTYQPLVYPAALLALMFGLVSFPGSGEQSTFTHYTFPLLAFGVEVGLEVFLLLTALILRKRGSA